MHEKHPFLARKGDGGFNWGSACASKGDGGFDWDSARANKGDAGFTREISDAGGRWRSLAGLRADAEPHISTASATGVEGAGGHGGHGRASRSITPSEARVWRSRGRPGPTAPGTPAAPQAPPNGEASELLVVLRVLIGLAAVGAAERADRRHLLVGQREGEDVEVLALTLGRAGLWQGHGAELVVPAQDEPRRGHAHVGGESDDRRVFDDAPLAPQRTPGLGEHADLCVIGQRGGLREVGVQLDLVDTRVLAGLGVHAVEVFGQEVAHADGADQAAVAGVQQGLEGLDVEAALGVGPVDQVHVPVVQAGAHEGFFEGVDGLVVALVASGELGDEAQLLTGNATAADRRPEGALVLVVEGAIQHAIPGLDARHHGGHARGAAQVVGAQRDRGNIQAVGQGVCGDLTHSSSVGHSTRGVLPLGYGTA